MERGKARDGDKGVNMSYVHSKHILKFHNKAQHHYIEYVQMLVPFRRYIMKI